MSYKKNITAKALPNPLIGALSHPVRKTKNLFFSSSFKECTTSQKCLIVGELMSYPSSYLVDFSNSLKSRITEPQIIDSNSSLFINFIL